MGPATSITTARTNYILVLRTEDKTADRRPCAPLNRGRLAWQNPSMVTAGIVGATGYMGGEALRILLEHPGVEVVWATSRAGDELWLLSCRAVTTVSGAAKGVGGQFKAWQFDRRAGKWAAFEPAELFSFPLAPGDGELFKFERPN